MSEVWDFFPCQIEDAPASILVDLGLVDRSEELAGLSVLHRLSVRMLDSDTHGMGGSDEAAAMYAIEDQILAGAKDGGLQYLGRLRSRGSWDLAFMGSEEHASTLEALAALATSATGREYELHSEPDAAWTFYRDFLYPSPERMQWIQDRKVVEALQSHGDTLEEPRRVLHWVYFPDSDARTFFAADAQDNGFETESIAAAAEGAAEGESEPSAESAGLILSRVDSVQLEDIHQLVMWICDLAAQHGGSYDGWETAAVVPKKRGLFAKIFGKGRRSEGSSPG